MREFDCPGESSLDWSPDGTTLAAGSSNAKRVDLYDVETGRRIGALPDEMGQGHVGEIPAGGRDCWPPRAGGGNCSSGDPGRASRSSLSRPDS